MAQRARRRAALTLVEVMMGVLVIGTAALAALAALLFSFRLADSNLRSLTALSAARSVMEQIVALDYTTLSGTTLPVDIPSIANGSMSVSSWNNRTVDIHATPTLSSDDLVLSIWPEVTQSNPNTLFACTQVIVHYRWDETAFFKRRTREDSLTYVTSAVNSY